MRECDLCGSHGAERLSSPLGVAAACGPCVESVFRDEKAWREWLRYSAVLWRARALGLTGKE